jgi:hypothetical protein
MKDLKNTANSRLTQITDFLTMNKTASTIPWDPNSTKFPTRKELPNIPGAPGEAAWVWGDDDYVSPKSADNPETHADEELDWPFEPANSIACRSRWKRG